MHAGRASDSVEHRLRTSQSARSEHTSAARACAGNAGQAKSDEDQGCQKQRGGSDEIETGDGDRGGDRGHREYDVDDSVGAMTQQRSRAERAGCEQTERGDAGRVDEQHGGV